MNPDYYDYSGRHHEGEDLCDTPQEEEPQYYTQYDGRPPSKIFDQPDFDQQNYVEEISETGYAMIDNRGLFEPKFKDYLYAFINTLYAYVIPWWLSYLLVFGAAAIMVLGLSGIWFSKGQPAKAIPIPMPGPVAAASAAHSAAVGVAGVMPVQMWALIALLGGSYVLWCFPRIGALALALLGALLVFNQIMNKAKMDFYIVGSGVCIILSAVGYWGLYDNMGEYVLMFFQCQLMIAVGLLAVSYFVSK